MLKSGKILFTALALVAASWAVSTGRQDGGSPQAQKAPAAFAPENRHRFPDVYEGVRVKHGFEIRNQGRVPLEIRNVRTA